MRTEGLSELLLCFCGDVGGEMGGLTGWGMAYDEVP